MYDYPLHQGPAGPIGFTAGIVIGFGLTIIILSRRSLRRKILGDSGIAGILLYVVMSLLLVSMLPFACGMAGGGIARIVFPQWF